PDLLTNIVLYPNPADKLLILKGTGENEGKEYSVFSVEGKLMLQGKLMPETTTILIDILPKGIYLLKINCDKLQVHKFTKY
ncbi:MAG: T9SS type A sorting domain-containing protein, partial [Paludibacter sp.]|nr:T9SS type A sorting domain-containing protein [Paludibacter sp.]